MRIRTSPTPNHHRQDRRLLLLLLGLLLACVLYVLWPRPTEAVHAQFSATSFFQEDTLGLHPPVLALDFSDPAWLKLEEKRAAALKQGLLITSEDDWVAAELSVNDQKMPAKVRLKGDWLDHLQGNKWSFRIKLKNGYSWRGMTVFSLHTPAARYHVHEWLLHQVWRSADVLSPRYDFAQLEVNGEPLGIYAYEEHFVKQLPEQQQRREGPLLKWDEGGYWSGIARQLDHHGYQKNGATLSAMDPERAPRGVFEVSSWRETPERQGVLQQALTKVEQLENGESAALDLDRFADYLAIADAFNAYHGLTWHNQRLFYNPITDLLEPVGFDGYGGPPAKQYGLLGQGAGSGVYSTQHKLDYLWSDSGFVRRYLKAIKHYTSEAFWIQLELDIGDAFQKRKRWLADEFPNYNGSIQQLTEDNQYLNSLIAPFEVHSLVAHLETTGDSTFLRLQNLHHFPLEVVGWGWTSAPQVDGRLTPLSLPGLPQRDLRSRLQRDGSIGNWNSIRFREEIAMEEQQPPGVFRQALRERPRFVYYRLLGGAELYAIEVQPYVLPDTPQTPIVVDKLVDHSRIRVTDQDVYFPADTFSLTRSLDIPSGYTVHLPAGLHLRIGDGAFLRSQSPVVAKGEPSSPILITGAAGSGGLAILNAEKPSQFSQVVFDGLGTPSRKGWALTGAVTTYETKATFYRCRWQNNTCEDALNAFRTDLELTDCAFLNTAFDAFDGDFCKATVTNCQFENIGNDAIDFSGSIATLKNIQINGVGDKGLSVGEASDVTWLSGAITDAKLGMASKDLSTLRVQEVTLENCRLGYAAYQKKPEYGPAVLLVEQQTDERVKRLYEAGSGSRVEVE